MKIWWMAIRPKTLWLSICPVVIATVVAYARGLVNWPLALSCLLMGLAVQITANLANDYFDFKKGADTAQRIGPTRVMQAGLVAPLAMRRAIALAISMAFGAGMYLAMKAGWPMAVVCTTSVVASLCYTAGPYPIAHNGWGEWFVIVFFGVVAVGATYFAQTLTVPTDLLVAGLAPGCISCGVLVINNLRDMEQDARAQRRTLAVRYGATFARAEYLLFMLAAGCVPLFLVTQYGYPTSTLLASLILVPALPLLRTVLMRRDGPSLNKALASTARLLFLYTALFAFGWLL